MIGGNTQMQLQVKSATQNDIGEHVESWETVQTVTGWLDLRSGESNYNTFDAKMQESTHIFVCDFVTLQATIQPETSRAIINSKMYDIVLIDNPMELNRQLEIYLKFTGGQ